MSELQGRITDKHLLATLIDNDFKSLVNMLRANIYKAEPVVSPSTILLCLDTGYAFAKRIYLKLRDDGYLDEEDRLIYQPYHFPVRHKDSTEQQKQNTFLSGCSALPLTPELIANCLSENSNTPQDTVYPLFTGIPPLDKATEGFPDGSFTLLAASQDTDRTEFSLALAVRIAEYSLIKQPVLYVSLNKSLSDIGLQFCLAAGEISSDGYPSENISLQQYCEIHRHLGLLRFPDGQSRLFLDEGRNLTVMQLEEMTIRAMDQCNGLSCIIVDAIDLIENRSADSTSSALSGLIEELCWFAAMLRVPVIAALRLPVSGRNGMRMTSYDDFSEKTGILLPQQKISSILLSEAAHCSSRKKFEYQQTLTILKNNRFKRISLSPLQEMHHGFYRETKNPK